MNWIALRLDGLEDAQLDAVARVLLDDVVRAGGHLREHARPEVAAQDRGRFQQRACLRRQHPEVLVERRLHPGRSSSGPPGARRVGSFHARTEGCPRSRETPRRRWAAAPGSRGPTRRHPRGRGAGSAGPRPRGRSCASASATGGDSRGSNLARGAQQAQSGHPGACRDTNSSKRRDGRSAAWRSSRKISVGCAAAAPVSTRAAASKR